MTGLRQITADLRAVFRRFPLSSLEHLRENRHRLVRGAYATAAGGGCIMSLLSERHAPENRIHSRESLTRYFGGDPHAAEYQPAKWIVRLWDQQICSEAAARYGSDAFLSEDLLMAVLDESIAERQATEGTPRHRLPERSRQQTVGRRLTDRQSRPLRATL